jgi:hypothetical protein
VHFRQGYWRVIHPSRAGCLHFHKVLPEIVNVAREDSTPSSSHCPFSLPRRAEICVGQFTEKSQNFRYGIGRISRDVWISSDSF